MPIILLLLLNCLLLFLIVISDDVNLIHHFRIDVFGSTVQFNVAALFIIQPFRNMFQFDTHIILLHFKVGMSLDHCIYVIRQSVFGVIV